MVNIDTIASRSYYSSISRSSSSSTSSSNSPSGLGGFSDAGLHVAAANATSKPSGGAPSGLGGFSDAGLHVAAVNARSSSSKSGGSSSRSSGGSSGVGIFSDAGLHVAASNPESSGFVGNPDDDDTSSRHQSRRISGLIGGDAGLRVAASRRQDDISVPPPDVVLGRLKTEIKSKPYTELEVEAYKLSKDLQKEYNELVNEKRNLEELMARAVASGNPTRIRQIQQDINRFNQKVAKFNEKRAKLEMMSKELKVRAPPEVRFLNIVSEFRRKLNILPPTVYSPLNPIFGHAAKGAAIGAYDALTGLPSLIAGVAHEERARIELSNKPKTKQEFFGMEWSTFNKQVEEGAKWAISNPGESIPYIVSSLAVGEILGKGIGKGVGEIRKGIGNVKLKLTEMKPEFTVIEIGDQKTVMKGKPPANIALTGAKDLGRIREIKPVSATVAETAFRLQKDEGVGVGKITQRLGFEIKTEKGEPIRVTTLYRNRLGKKAMITSEFGEDTIKIVAKSGRESKGYGLKIIESQPIKSQEITEKPVIRSIGNPKEFIPIERVKPKVIDVRGLLERLPEENRELEVGRGIEQVEKSGSKITLLDVSKEVKALESTLTPPVEVPVERTFVAPIKITPTIINVPSFLNVITIPSLQTGLKASRKFQPHQPITQKAGNQPATNILTHIGSKLGLNLRSDELVKTTQGILATPEIGLKVSSGTKSDLLTVPSLKTGILNVPATVPITSPKPTFGKPPTPSLKQIPLLRIPPLFGGGGGLISLPSPGFPKSSRRKTQKVALEAGFAELSAYELFTGRKGAHYIGKLAVPFWKLTLSTAGLVETPVAQEIKKNNKKKKKRRGRKR